MIELSLEGIRAEQDPQRTNMLFKEKDGDRTLLIWIGEVEATSIAFALEGTEPPRPQTHDLLANVLKALDDLIVERIVITQVLTDGDWKGTFLAEIRCSHHGNALVVDARPSDAVALAVRLGVPIFADTGVETAFIAA